MRGDPPSSEKCVPNHDIITPIVILGQWFIRKTGLSIYFQGGTLVLDGFSEADILPAPLKRIKSRWRCEAYHYPSLHDTFHTQQIHDNAPRWGRPKLTLHDQRQPHTYQVEALKAWEQAQRCGSIVLPTGTGKTFVAIHAIHDAKCSTLVVAPTKDLLNLSRQAIRAINQNLIFSLAVLAVAVGLTTVGILTPVTGALLHELSSLTVIANSARLIGLKEKHPISDAVKPA